MWPRVAFTALAVFVSATIVYWMADQVLVAPIVAGQTQVARLQVELDEVTQRLAVSRHEFAAISSDLPNTSGLALSGMDRPSALAWLQGLVRSQVAAAQGTALAFQATTSPLGDSHEKISVVLRARFSEPGMLSFIRQLEQASPPLIFEQLEVQQLGVASGGAPIDLTATITAFHAHAASS